MNNTVVYIVDLWIQVCVAICGSIGCRLNINVSLILIGLKQFDKVHWAKSGRIRSFSCLYFPPFGLNTERYGVSLCIQSECGKIRTRNTPNTDTFHAVVIFPLLSPVFWTISASHLNSLQITFSIGSSIKLLLQWLILFRPLLPKGISLAPFDLSEQLWEGILICSDLQEKNWLVCKNKFDVNTRSTVFSPISGHRWSKKNYPLIGGVRLLESFSISVLILRIKHFSISIRCSWVD